MKNKNISDFVAASMNAVINSEQHKSLFNPQYKTASSAWDKASAKDKKCTECGQKADACYCMPADDEPPMPADDMMLGEKSEDEESGDRSLTNQSHVKDLLCNFILKHQSKLPVLTIPGFPLFKDRTEVLQALLTNSFEIVRSVKLFLKRLHGMSPVEKLSHDKMVMLLKQDKDADLLSMDMPKVAAFNVAIDSLLTASAALDSVGMANGSALSLKLASLVVEAKKKMSPEEKKKLLERLQKGKKPADKASAKTPAKSDKASAKSDKASSKSHSHSAMSKKKVVKASFDDDDDDGQLFDAPLGGEPDFQADLTDNRFGNPAIEMDYGTGLPKHMSTDVADPSTYSEDALHSAISEMINLLDNPNTSTETKHTLRNILRDFGRERSKRETDRINMKPVAEFMPEV